MDTHGGLLVYKTDRETGHTDNSSQRDGDTRITVDREREREREKDCICVRKTWR